MAQLVLFFPVRVRPSTEKSVIIKPFREPGGKEEVLRVGFEVFDAWDSAGAGTDEAGVVGGFPDLLVACEGTKPSRNTGGLMSE